MFRNWQGLIRPETVRTDRIDATYGRFTLEPLERGFGTTLGAALRKAMLGSIPGDGIVAYMTGAKAFTCVRIIEPFSEVVEALKQVVVVATAPALPVRATLDVWGPAAIRADDLRGDGLRIVNPDYVLGHVAAGGHLRLELVVQRGFGYAENAAPEELGHDAVPVAAMLAPVRRVNYSVSNARVGQRTDYDRLELEIWTNGAITPSAALAKGAKVLREQLVPFINFDEAAVDERAAARPTQGAAAVANAHLSKPVATLELSARAARCLAELGVEQLSELVQLPEKKLLEVRGIGVKSVAEIKDLLGELGLSFAQTGGRP